MKKTRSRKPSSPLAPKPRLLQPSVRSNWNHYSGHLSKSVDILPLGVFRFLFGLLLSLEFFVVSRETFPSDYIRPIFHFTYPLFDLLGFRPLTESYLWVVFHALRISAICIMLGFFTRITLILFTLCFGYFFFMESTVYTNHYYLIFLISLLLCFGHSGSILSIDSLINRKSRRTSVLYWEIFLLRYQVCLVFLFGGLAKLNKAWLIDAAPVYLNLVKHLSILGYPLQEKWMALVLSWTGMLSDFGLGIALIVGRWHKFTFAWLCLFNGINVALFGLGIKTFPYLMVATYVLFLPAPFVRRAVECLLGNKSRSVIRI